MMPPSHPLANPSPTPGLMGLEKSGVLMNRMLHELTNSLSVLAGHVQLLEALPPDPDRWQDSLRSIKWASDAMGEMVERYAEFKRRLGPEPASFTMEDLATALRQGPAANPAPAGDWRQAWEVIAPECAAVSFRFEPRWIRFAAWEVVRLCRANSGRIELWPPGKSFDSRGLKGGLNPARSGNAHLAIRWKSERPALAEDDLFKPPSLDLALVVGIVRWAGGQTSYGFLPPDENRFWMALPGIGRL